MRHRRVDFAGTVRKPQVTPQGGLRLDAAFTRVGVLRYSDHEGREWGELRLPEEVFAQASLDTLRGAPVVDLHPKGMVTADSFKTLVTGHVHDELTRDGDLLVGRVTVNDAAEVALINAGERRELSCGYECDLDPTPGVYEPTGERYDAVQRSIRYNHVGLGPEGWGRAGSEVALRLDGAAVQVRLDGARGDGMKKKIRLGGREIHLDAAEDEASAQGAVDELQKKADSGDEAIKACDAATAALTDAMAQIATLKATIAAASAATPQVTEAMVPEAVADSLVAKRLKLLEGARSVLGATVKLDGMKAAEIKAKVVNTAFPTVKLDGLSAERVEGLFDAALAGGVARNDALGRAHFVAAGGGVSEGDVDPAAELRVDSSKRWQKPLSVSLGGAK